ncbi:MAG: hypothetical protein ABIR47_16870, partial [Candidatus Kapaibacterium sp.]
MDVNLDELTPSLMEFVSAALTIGMTCLEDGESFSPFVVLDKDGDQKVIVIEGETMPDAVDKARKIVATLGDNISRAIIAYDSYMNIDGTKYDAVIAEIREAGSDHGLRFAQRYLNPQSGGRAEATGKKMFLGSMPLVQFYG